MLTAIVGSEGILRLARSRSPADRQRLMLLLARLCTRQESARTEVQVLLRDIVCGLAGQAERDVRRRLAEIVAPSRWAPRELILTLARDEFEVARPIIAESPLLGAEELIQLVNSGDAARGVEVARRRDLPPRVVRAILATGEPRMAAALAANRDVKLPCDASQAVSPAFDARIRMERRVVGKLKAGGQLRPGLLLRALHENRLPLFVAALSELGGLDTEETKAALWSDSPDALIRTCVRIGLDSSVIARVVQLVRSLNDGRPGPAPERRRRDAQFDKPLAPRPS